MNDVPPEVLELLAELLIDIHDSPSQIGSAQISISPEDKETLKTFQKQLKVWMDVTKITMKETVGVLLKLLRSRNPAEFKRMVATHEMSKIYRTTLLNMKAVAWIALEWKARVIKNIPLTLQQDWYNSLSQNNRPTYLLARDKKNRTEHFSLPDCEVLLDHARNWYGDGRISEVVLNKIVEDVTWYMHYLDEARLLLEERGKQDMVKYTNLRAKTQEYEQQMKNSLKLKGNPLSAERQREIDKDE